MLFKQQPLCTYLHALWVVGVTRNMRALAALVVHRDDFAFFALHQVDLGDEV